MSIINDYVTPEVEYCIGKIWALSIWPKHMGSNHVDRVNFQFYALIIQIFNVEPLTMFWKSICQSQLSQSVHLIIPAFFRNQALPRNNLPASTTIITTSLLSFHSPEPYFPMGFFLAVPQLSWFALDHSIVIDRIYVFDNSWSGFSIKLFTHTEPAVRGGSVNLVLKVLLRS